LHTSTAVPCVAARPHRRRWRFCLFLWTTLPSPGSQKVVGSLVWECIRARARASYLYWSTRADFRRLAALLGRVGSHAAPRAVRTRPVVCRSHCPECVRLDLGLRSRRPPPSPGERSQNKYAASPFLALDLDRRLGRLGDVVRQPRRLLPLRRHHLVLLHADRAAPGLTRAPQSVATDVRRPARRSRLRRRERVPH